MSRVCPSKFIFTNQRNEQRKKGCYECGELGHFVEVCPNKPTPKTKKACKDKALTSIRSWDDSSSEEEDHHKRRGHKHSSHQALHVCALWHEVTKSLSLAIVTIIVIVMMSYLLMMKLCKKILTLLKFALVNKRSLKN